MKKLLIVVLMAFTFIFQPIKANTPNPEFFATWRQGFSTVAILDRINNTGFDLNMSFPNLRYVYISKNNDIYMSYNELTKYNSNFTVEWTFTNFTDIVNNSVADNNNNVYGVSLDSTLRKINNNGIQEWTVNLPSIAYHVVTDDSYIYTLSFTHLNKYDLDGNLEWSTSISSFNFGFINQTNFSRLVLDDNGNVAIGEPTGIATFDSNGNNLQSFTGNDITNLNLPSGDEEFLFGDFHYSNGFYYIQSRENMVKFDLNLNFISIIIPDVIDDYGGILPFNTDSFGNFYHIGDASRGEVYKYNDNFELQESININESISINNEIIVPSYVVPEPPTYTVELTTNFTDYIDFIYSDNVSSGAFFTVDTIIDNDEPFSVTSGVIDISPFTFNFWYDLDNEEIFSTERGINIEDPDRNYNLSANYTLNNSANLSINSNLPSPPNFELIVDTIENNTNAIIQYPINENVPFGYNYQIVAPTNNIGFYEFDYWYDNDNQEIYSQNDLISQSAIESLNLTATYSLPEEYQINLTLESAVGVIMFQHGNLDPVTGTSISVTIGEGDTWSATAPDNPDFQFNQWIDLDNGDQTFSNNKVIGIDNTTQNYNLKALYFELVEVNWDSAGGTPIAQQKVIIGSSIQPPSEPTRPGFVFDYWEDSDNNEVIYPKNVSEDVTFTAIWLETFTVDFQVNGGAPVPSQIVLENATINVVTPSRFGHTFEGWYTDNVTFNNAFDFNTPIDQDDTLFAKWAFGTENNAEQSLNVFLVNSNLDDPFAQIIIVLAFFVLLNAIIYVYSGPMIVTLILNFILTALFMVLGFIPFWIIIMIFIAIFGFALLMLFGGRSAA